LFGRFCGTIPSSDFSLSRDNLDEKSGDQDENGRIAEWVDDCRWRGDAQAVFAG
jgi:hypothetical protein